MKPAILILCLALVGCEGLRPTVAPLGVIAENKTARVQAYLGGGTTTDTLHLVVDAERFDGNLPNLLVDISHPAPNRARGEITVSTR